MAEKPKTRLIIGEYPTICGGIIRNTHIEGSGGGTEEIAGLISNARRGVARERRAKSEQKSSQAERVNNKAFPEVFHGPFVFPFKQTTCNETSKCQVNSLHDSDGEHADCGGSGNIINEEGGISHSIGLSR